MDFTAIILFLVIYYIRPQEWIGLFASLSPVKLVMLMAMAGTVNRYKSFKFSDFFQTPHDWLMFIYIAWVIYASGSYFATFMEFLKYIVFYWVIVLTLTSIPRIQTFLNWWTVMILAVAALAVSSLYIWDPMGAKDLTENFFEGRLVLATSIFNNPNALGHGVVPVVPMLYFLFLWKRPIFVKEVALLLMLLPVYCLYHTFSKGSYLSGGVTLLAGLMFGRPKIIQISMVVLALTGGVTVIKTLPRMEELNRNEGGIAGRLAAWEWGLSKMDSEPYGIGWKRFVPMFNQEMHFNKAAHSSYVQTGTELGYTGLFLFLGVLYGGLRTVMTIRTATVEEERIRRMLFCLVLSFTISSWVIDFGARSTFFMIPGAIAAFQRQIMNRHRRDVEAAKKELEEFERAAKEGKALEEAVVTSDGFTERLAGQELKRRREEIVAKVNVRPPIKWARLGPLDFVVVYIITNYAVAFWRAILEGKYL